MDKLLLLQFGCFVTTLMLTMLLVVSRMHIQQINRRYEKARWILCACLSLFSCHYLLQMLFGFRAQGDDVGAVINILFYAPCSYLAAYAILSLSTRKYFLRRFLRGAMCFYAAILITFIAGLAVYESLHMPMAMYVMEGELLASMIWVGYSPSKEAKRMKQRIVNETASDLGNYSSFLRTGYGVLHIFQAIAMITIFSRQWLAVVGTLFFIAVFCFVVSFVCMGYNMTQVTDIIESEEDNEKIGLTEEVIDKIETVLSEWINRNGFIDPDTSIISLSRRMGVQPTVLSHYITQYHNVTFRVWLSKLRIKEAKRLLTLGAEYSNDVIAEECGFTSRNYFQFVFKAETGFTPKEWRKNAMGQS